MLLFAVIAVLHALAEFGLPSILLHEMARDREQMATILGTAIPLLLLIGWTASGLVVLAGQLLPMARQARTALTILALGLPLTFAAVALSSVSRACEHMGTNALVLILQRLLMLGSILIAVGLDGGLPSIALCYVGERGFQWGLFRILVPIRYNRYRWRPDLTY